jgi:endo-1,4-beta-xylanase
MPFKYSQRVKSSTGDVLTRENLQMSRREALLAGLQLAAQAALLTASPALMAESGSPSQSMTLKSAGATRGCQVGASAPQVLLQDASIAQFVVRNFNLLTASGLKWEAIHPQPDSYNFTEADWNINFAEKNGMRVHGHNLCWNSPTNPAWLKSVLDPGSARQLLTSHITTVMRRYQGRVDSWDVVNEPVVAWSHRSDGLYPGIWLDRLGPQYIDIAFHAAALADPKPLRILNIYNVEQGTPEHELTRTRTINLLKQLVARGVPIQAVGLESHLDASRPLGQVSFLEFIKEIRALGLEVIITELDVMESRATGSSKDWDQTVAKYYGDYITQIMSAAHPRFVIFWSIEDGWLGGRRIQGLTWDHLKPRPSYQAAQIALQQKSSR